MIVGAICQQDLGTCSYDSLGLTVVTLYACSLVRVSVKLVAVFWTIAFVFMTCPCSYCRRRAGQTHKACMHGAETGRQKYRYLYSLEFAKSMSCASCTGCLLFSFLPIKRFFCVSVIDKEESFVYMLEHLARPMAVSKYMVLEVRAGLNAEKQQKQQQQPVWAGPVGHQASGVRVWRPPRSLRAAAPQHRPRRVEGGHHSTARCVLFVGCFLA